MKKLVLSAIIAMSVFGSSAEAHWRGGCCYRGGWVAPALIGGVIGYELAQPRYYAPPPVYYTPPPSVVYVQPPVIPQTAPEGYHWEQILDSNCNCHKTVLVPNY
jgi:hypothetical protein